MRTQFPVALLLITLAPILPSRGQVQGDLIGGPPATNAAPAAAKNTTATNGDFYGFDRLAGFPVQETAELDYNTNRPAWADARINAMIPPSIKAADGKKVTIEGFMTPETYDQKGMVTSFLITMNPPSCCYGGPSQIHEFVDVKVTGPGVKWAMDDPVRVQGVLHVGARRDDGVLSSIYQMDAAGLDNSKP